MFSTDAVDAEDSLVPEPGGTTPDAEAAASEERAFHEHAGPLYKGDGVARVGSGEGGGDLHHPQPQELFVSVLTLGELRRGAERISRRDPRSAAALRAWLERTRVRFRDRIVGVGGAVADRWGRVSAADPLPDVGGLRAATALGHGMTVVTRNVRHMAPTGALHLNPFEPMADPDQTMP